jgi:hypothetical protein
MIDWWKFFFLRRSTSLRAPFSLWLRRNHLDILGGSFDFIEDEPKRIGKLRRDPFLGDLKHQVETIPE